MRLCPTVPELPEVETIRAGLASNLGGVTLTGVRVLHPRPVRSHPGGPDGFASDLAGRIVTAVRRRGKYLWLAFDDGDALLVHLRMSGQFRWDDPSFPLQRHTRVVFDTDAGRQLRYLDQRMLGGLGLSHGGAELPPEVAHIAVDPFDPAYDADRVAAVVRTRRAPVKALILDQRIVSGIGNIYADEALWRARVHYATPGRVLGARVTDVLTRAREVMGEAIGRGGTSFDTLYVNVNGESGYFARNLDAYGRQDLACRRCGAPIVRERFGGRSSFRCPLCQPATVG